MKLSELKELHSNLEDWIKMGIGDDIIILKDQRQEYQPYVNTVHQMGYDTEEIPAAVLNLLKNDIDNYKESFIERVHNKLAKVGKKLQGRG